MATLYSTSRGPSYDPLPVELWTWQGECLGKIGAFESMTFSLTAKPGRASTATLEVALNDLTAKLLPCDGSVMVAAYYHGLTLLFVPVTAEAKSLDSNPSQAVVVAHCTDGWSFLEGMITTPDFNGKINTTPADQFEVVGDLEVVVKKLINVGLKRTGSPLVLVQSSARGPRLILRGAFESVAEHVEKALTNNGYMLDFRGWVPGQPQPLEGVNLTQPCYIVDVRPHVPKQGLAWSYLSGDLTSWSVTRKRGSATRAIVHNGAEDSAERRIIEVMGMEPQSPWGVREIFVQAKIDDDENMDPIRIHHDLETAGVDKLTERASAVEISVSVEAHSSWEFGVDGEHPRQYYLGDVATVELPILGEMQQVVTDVELKITPDTFTVKPTVGTPDTLDITTVDLLASVDKRLARLERKGF